MTPTKKTCKTCGHICGMKTNEDWPLDALDEVGMRCDSWEAAT